MDFLKVIENLGERVHSYKDFVRHKPGQIIIPEDCYARLVREGYEKPLEFSVFSRFGLEFYLLGQTPPFVREKFLQESREIQFPVALSRSRGLFRKISFQDMIVYGALNCAHDFH